MEKETHTTKEEAIIAHLDEGGALSTALAKHGADHADTKLYSALYDMKNDEIQVPPRATFLTLLERLNSKEPALSPYAPTKSPFTGLRFVMPVMLGLLIVVSGVGLETGRISFEDSAVPVVSLRVADDAEFSTSADTTKVALSNDDNTTMRAMTTPATSTATSDTGSTEEYSTYFEEESTAFTNIADAYEITI
jgi:hypothetical protein